MSVPNLEDFKMQDELANLILARLGYFGAVNTTLPDPVYLDLQGKLYYEPAVKLTFHGIPRFARSNSVSGLWPYDTKINYELNLVKGPVFLCVGIQSGTCTFSWSKDIRVENLKHMAMLKHHLETATDEELISHVASSLEATG